MLPRPSSPTSARQVRAPARHPPNGAWPAEMRADVAAAFLDYDRTGQLYAALEHGVPGDVISRALTRNRDGSVSGPVGAVLDLLSAFPCAAASNRSTPLPVEEGAP
jgi:hypothetical protein